MNVLGLFAKYWEPGQVKTRLAKSIGEENAAVFHQRCVRTLTQRLQSTADRRVAAFAPAARRKDFAEAVSVGWELQPQSNGDLGARLESFFDDLFDAGASRVIVIGADCPDLTTNDVDEAIALLGAAPTVFGPATDGGYYLVGATGSTPPVFQGVSWGEETVWETTQRQLRDAGITWRELPARRDVDEFEDLRDLHARLSDLSEPSLAPLAELVKRLVQ